MAPLGELKLRVGGNGEVEGWPRGSIVAGNPTLVSLLEFIQKKGFVGDLGGPGEIVLPNGKGNLRFYHSGGMRYPGELDSPYSSGLRKLVPVGFPISYIQFDYSHNVYFGALGLEVEYFQHNNTLRMRPTGERRAIEVAFRGIIHSEEEKTLLGAMLMLTTNMLQKVPEQGLIVVSDSLSFPPVVGMTGEQYVQLFGSGMGIERDNKVRSIAEGDYYTGERESILFGALKKGQFRPVVVLSSEERKNRGRGSLLE